MIQFSKNCGKRNFFQKLFNFNIYISVVNSKNSKRYSNSKIVLKKIMLDFSAITSIQYRSNFSFYLSFSVPSHVSIMKIACILSEILSKPLNDFNRLRIQLALC